MTLAITPRALELGPLLDTVIFDMDGVLIDISRSIRQINLLAPPFYLRELLGWRASDTILTSDDIEHYKHAGGFNNDWDLTCAIVLLYLIKSSRYGVADADALNPLAPLHTEFAKSIGERGGGLSVAETILFAGLDSADSEAIEANYRKDIIYQVFQEMFAGEATERIYSRPAAHYHGPGLVEQDRCIVELGLMPRGKKLGVQTGRSYVESVIGRELCGLMDFLPDSVCVTATDGVHKPDPGGLMLLADRLGTRNAGIYIGDTLDDLRTVRNLNGLGAAPPFLGALVLSGPAGQSNETIFREAEPDIIGRDVNEVLQWINKSSST